MKTRAWGISILFLFAILFYSLRLSVAFFHYAIFNDSFTALYCVNQDKPALKCNGKCHLLKETQKSLTHQASHSLQDELHLSINLICSDSFSYKQKCINFQNLKALYTIYVNHYKAIFIKEFFEPPIC